MHLFSGVKLGRGAIALLVAIAGALALAGSALATGGQNAAGSASAGAPAAIASCAGSHVWAVVNSDGTLARHGAGCANTVSDSQGTGSFEVIFPKVINHCAFEATVGLSGSSGVSIPGYATVVGRATTTHGVFVQTFDTSGALTSLGFHLVVSC